MSVSYPAGRYRLRILSADLGEAKSGNPQVEIVVQPEGSGPPRRVYLTLTDSTLGTPSSPGWVWETLKFLGFVGPSFADLEPLVGKECEGACKHGTDEKGEPREEWNIFRGNSGPKTVLPPQGVKRLDSKFAGLLRNGHGQPASVPATRPQAQPMRPSQGQPRPPHDEDSIPF